jgi:hypothetical protein
MLLPIKIPPGVVRPGTVYDAKGRWYNGHLVRWQDGVLAPVKGFAPVYDFGPGGLQLDIGGECIGEHKWVANNGAVWVALGTSTKLYMIVLRSANSGLMYDVTPAGFVAAATPWTMDNYGEDLVACSDGTIYYVDTSTVAGSGGIGAALTNAPTCRAVFVTPERFIVALGVNGDPREVAWCDQDDPTVWTSTDTNSAGDFPVASTGRLLVGKRGRGESLIWSDTDLWSMRYIGGELIYRFEYQGQGGVYSSRTVAMFAGKAVWLGTSSFYMYDGYVRAIPCDVSDYLFGDADTRLLSPAADTLFETTLIPRLDHGEVWLHYIGGTPRYVVLSVNDGWWMTGEGSYERTGGVDKGPSEYVITVDFSGKVWAEEVNLAAVYTNADEPFIESGPVEIGNGDNAMMATRLIPDGKTTAGVMLTFKTSFYPTQAETDHGPYTMANPRSLRFTAAQFRVRVEGDPDSVAEGDPINWRYGTPRLEIVARGTRR